MAEIDIHSTEYNWNLKYSFAGKADQIIKREQYDAFMDKHSEIVNGSGEGTLSISDDAISFALKQTIVESSGGTNYNEWTIKLFTSDVDGTAQFDTGDEPLPVEFYQDLFDLMNKDGECLNSDGDTATWDAMICGSAIEGSGYATLIFKKGGIFWDDVRFDSSEDSSSEEEDDLEYDEE